MKIAGNPNHQAMHGGVTITGAAKGMSGLRLDSKDDFERVARVQLQLRGFREDAGQTRAFARSLEHIFAKLYMAEFPEYKATSLFPVNTEVEPGAASFTYRMGERTGQAAVINAGNAGDLPVVDVAGEEWPAQVITLGAGYGFNVIDEQAAQKMQVAIEAEKAMAAREAIAQLEDQIFCTGYAATGTSGVTNALGVQATTQVSTGTWSSQLATAYATAPTTSVPYPAVGAVSAIVSDIKAMTQAIYTSTLGRHKATHCVLPVNLYGMLDSLPRSPAFTDDDVLSYIERVTGLVIDDWAQLQNAGAINGSGSSMGSTDAFKTRVMVYEKNPEVMSLVIAQPFVQLAPQPRDLTWKIPCYSRIGGAMSVRPLGVRYMDGL
jgi:hypothetical protein